MKKYRWTITTVAGLAVAFAFTIFSKSIGFGDFDSVLPHSESGWIQFILQCVLSGVVMYWVARKLKNE